MSALEAEMPARVDYPTNMIFHLPDHSSQSYWSEARFTQKPSVSHSLLRHTHTQLPVPHTLTAPLPLDPCQWILNLRTSYGP